MYEIHNFCMYICIHITHIYVTTINLYIIHLLLLTYIYMYILHSCLCIFVCFDMFYLISLVNLYGVVHVHNACFVHCDKYNSVHSEFVHDLMLK